MSASENECSGALLGDDDAIDEMSILLEEMEKSEAGGALNDDPIEDPRMERMITIWNNIACDNMVRETFKYKVSWHWNGEAKYLILIALPTFDKNSLLLDIDPKSTITKYFNKIFEPNSFLIMPCVLGHNGNTFQSVPTLKEFAVSAPYIKEIIQTINPVCIFTIDAFPAEAMRCDMNPQTVYMSRDVTMDIKSIPQLIKAVDMGALMRTTLGGVGSFRYIILPRFSQKGKAFEASIMKHREDLDHYTKFRYKSTPASIFDPEYNFPRENMDKYSTFESMIESMLTDPTYDAMELRPNLHMLHDQQRRSQYMFLTAIQFDHDLNMMRCFFSTPYGYSHVFQILKMPMQFGFVPHAAFCMDPAVPTGGVFADLAENLNVSHLRPLHDALCDKLRWVFEYKKRDIRPDIKLGITMARLHGESFYYRQRKVITCEVTDYKLMKPIIQMLERLIKQWPVQNDQQFKPIETFSPEQIFSYNNTYKTCHWYRITDFDTIPHHECRNEHMRQIVSTVTYNPFKPPFECLMPDTNVEVGNGRLVTCIPPHVQVSMDIECVGEKNHFPDPWKDPINTICNTCWKKQNVGIETDSKSHKPLKGYLYVTFNLGYADATASRTDLVGNGIPVHYYFTNERDMLLAYCWWLHFMIPDYFMGHNFKAFDINYIVQRALVLGLTLPPLGRINNEIIRMDRHKMSTRAFGDRFITNVKGMSGCCLLDFLEILLRDFKLESNTLDFAGITMLGDTKLVMPYNALRGNWLKSPETFQKVIDYCVVDAQLVDRLINAKMCISNAMSLTMVNGTVTPNQLWELGMQIKVFSTIAHIAKLRSPEFKVMYPTFDGWSYLHNDTIVERHMVKNGAFDEQQAEEDEQEPKDDVIIFSAANSQAARSNRKRDVNISDACKQGLIDGSGEVVGAMNEAEYERRVKRMKKIMGMMPSSSSSSSVNVMEDYDKILKEIKLNGGKEEVVKSNIIDDTYTGAVVIDAPLGMYFELPNLCMDFEGLYPSIIMAYNLGETMIFESDRIACGYSLDQVHTPPDNLRVRNPRNGKLEIFHFVDKDIWPSAIAEAERFLKSARGDAKKKMAEAGAAGDINLKNFYNALQNNFKLIMNSIYGALGVTKGPIASKAVAMAVTAWGRMWIMATKQLCADAVGGVTVGGDTDSVFVKFAGILVNGKLLHRIRNREEAELFGPWLVKNILNPPLPPPMALAYEKMMWRLLTIAKKRYNYIHAELKQALRIAAKGMETVRRDTTKFTKATLKYMQNALLVPPSDEMLWLLYPKPRKANPFTFYTRYTHFIYTEKGFVYSPPPGYVMQPDCTNQTDKALHWTQMPAHFHEEHAKAMRMWAEMSAEQRVVHLQGLKKKWRDDEQKYFELQDIEIKANKQKLIDYVRKRADELINGKVSITQCIQSKQRSKETYKSNKQPHLTVISLKEERNEEVPQIGERVKFAYRSLPMSPNGKGKLKARRAYECAEDPIRIILDNEPVDWVYYFHNTFVKPVTRYMRWVLKDEMVERIQKRRQDARKRPTSMFVPVTKSLFKEALPTSAQPSSSSNEPSIIEEDITLGEITEEVTQFLFSTPTKKSPLYANLKTRYAKLITVKERALPYNNKRISPIAQHRDTTNEEARKLFERHRGKSFGGSYDNHTLADIEDLAKNIDSLTLSYNATYNKCMQTCITCLGTDIVECENIDCDEFLPRLDAQIKFDQIKKDKIVLDTLRR